MSEVLVQPSGPLPPTDGNVFDTIEPIVLDREAKRLLPPEVRTKLDHLNEGIVDAAAACKGIELKVANRQRDIQSASLTVVGKDPNNPHNKAAFKDARSEIKRLEEDLEVLKETFLRNVARIKNDKQMSVRMQTWLLRRPANFVVVAVERPPLENTTDLVASINAARDQVATLKQQRRELSGKPPSRSELKAEAAKWVEQTRRLVRPAISRDPFALRFELTEHESRVDLPKLFADLRHLAWLAPELMLARINELIDAEVPDEGNIGKEERDRRMKELDDLMLAVERSEERMVEEALVRGLPVLRRWNADPRAILFCDVMRSDLVPNAGQKRLSPEELKVRQEQRNAEWEAMQPPRILV